MKRIRIAGICFVAAFALSAVGASSALATLEFKPIAPAKFPVKFTSTSGKGILETLAKHKIECSSDTNEGSLLNATEDEATIRFKGCKAFSVATCTSPGAASGEIVSKVHSKLVWLNKSKKEVGILLTPLSGTLFAEFTCTFGVSAKLKVKGSILAAIPAADLNKPISSMSLEFVQSAGKQAHEEYEEPEGTFVKNVFLETESTGIETFPFEMSAIGTTDTLTLSGEAKGEIVAV
jgi:hypothetical protein